MPFKPKVADIDLCSVSRSRSSIQALMIRYVALRRQVKHILARIEPLLPGFLHLSNRLPLVLLIPLPELLLLGHFDRVIQEELP